MNRREHARYMARTRNAYASHNRRAVEHGKQLDYTLEQLRQAVAWTIGKPCPYCTIPITVKTFSIDHKIPVARAGSFEWSNTQIIDIRCNQIKGTMTEEEYRTFLTDLAKIPEPIRKNIMARMRAGAAIIRS
jgi:5-methylcytosine-specific restriction endonuclease McrA